jgi:uncharacterized protein YceK
MKMTSLLIPVVLFLALAGCSSAASDTDEQDATRGSTWDKLHWDKGKWE